MTQVTWTAGTPGYEMTLESRCSAPPEDVYEVLADLSTHLEWGGRQQRRSFRLTALRGAGRAQIGTEFVSTGTIPMSRSRWEDHSVVVRAEPATVLEFHTDGVATSPSGRTTRARWEHRYQIDPEDGGCHLVYRLQLADITNAPWRMRLPLARALTHRVMIPFLCRRGFTNLLREAERRTAAPVKG